MAELVLQGIQAANQDLVKENENRLMQEVNSCPSMRDNAEDLGWWGRSGHQTIFPRSIASYALPFGFFD